MARKAAQSRFSSVAVSECGKSEDIFVLRKWLIARGLPGIAALDRGFLPVIFSVLVVSGGVRDCWLPPRKLPRRAAERVPDAAEFARVRLGFEPDEKQAEVLRSEAKRGILNCSRQWGKSTVAAAKAVHRAYTRAGCLVLVASPGERQSAEFLRKAGAMVQRLGIEPRGDGDNPVSLLFPNGSRIVGLPGTEATVRGFSAVSMLVIDEASRVEDALYKALRPMLAVGDGDLWLMSTPCGKRGFFYEIWQHEDGWEKVSVPATECPRIRAEFLEEERGAMGRQWFEQEYLCCFVDNGAGLFDRDLIEAAVDEGVEGLRV
ncbi:MAG TPA: terminase family protein [Bryobacteraceae bacterium]|nr:terminase family protein [Bryobacteraceae bacterium]